MSEKIEIEKSELKKINIDKEFQELDKEIQEFNNKYGLDLKTIYSDGIRKVKKDKKIKPDMMCE